MMRKERRPSTRRQASLNKEASDEKMVPLSQVKELLHKMVDALEADTDGAKLELDLDSDLEVELESDEGEDGFSEAMENLEESFTEDGGEDEDGEDDEELDAEKMAALIPELDRLASLVEERNPKLAREIDVMTNTLEACLRGRN